MGLYAKSSFELLCEQVNRDNPELEVPFSRNTVVLLQGPLTTNLGSSKRNTRAIFNGIQGSGINGKKEVFYDRRDIGKLYGPAKIIASAPSTATVVKDLLPSLNEQLGLLLEPADLANGELSLGNASVQGSFTLQIAPTSVAYTGSLAISWKRAPVGIFPESGPGSKLMLFGSLEAGYFGVVPESALFNKIAFYNAINDGITPDIAGAAIAPETGGFYFKFAYKNRFIFVPSAPLMNNISWYDIYSKSAAYDAVRQNHLLPPGKEKVDQSQRIISVKEGSKLWQLKPRLPMAGNDDPSEVIGYPYPNKGGEWYDLFRHTTKLGPASTGAWDDKPQLGSPDHYEWILNTSAKAGGLAGYFYIPKSQTGIEFSKLGATNSRWRPVFEVVNDLNLLQGVRYGGSQVTGRLPSIVLNIELPPATERLAGVINVKGTIDAPAAGPLVETYVESIFPLKDVLWETEAAKAIGKGPVVDVVSERTLAIKHFKWTASDLPAVSNVSITR